jgi:hypothetical protein
MFGWDSGSVVSVVPQGTHAQKKLGMRGDER